MNKMTYEEYCESVKDIEPLRDPGLYSNAIMWLHPELLPLKLISVGEEQQSIVKVPAQLSNRYGNSVPVVGISDQAFAGNEQVTDIILPSSIENLPAGAFSGCRNLKNITIPKNIRIIRERTFEQCVNLENVFYEGTLEEWRKIEIVHEKHEIEFGKLIPGTPVHEILSERLVPVPGNEALLSATIHFRSELEKSQWPTTFQIKMAGIEVTELFRTD